MAPCCVHGRAPARGPTPASTPAVRACADDARRRVQEGRAARLGSGRCRTPHLRSTHAQTARPHVGGLCMGHKIQLPHTL
eukprot:344930-Chlamydomonas_euryale.AAC.1